MSFNSKVSALCSGKLNSLQGILTDYDRDILCSSFIAGGAITSIAKEKNPKDYDLFFTNEESISKTIRTLVRYANVELDFKVEADPINPNLKRGVLHSTTSMRVEEVIDSLNLWLKERDNNRISYVSKNAITLKNGLQIIFRFIGEPKEVFTTFDYEHCKIYWRPSPLGFSLGKVHFEGKSLESITKNELIYTNNSRFVLSALSRLNKFVKRGWGITTSSLLALAVSAGKIDWSDSKILEEELLGIYGIDNKTLSLILKSCTTESVVDLDKIIEILGEV
jgi:hypothetical protein